MALVGLLNKLPIILHNVAVFSAALYLSTCSEFDYASYPGINRTFLMNICLDLLLDQHINLQQQAFHSKAVYLNHLK